MPDADKSDKVAREGLPEYVEKVWSQALIAVSTAEDEATRLVARLAAAAGWGQDEVKRQVQELSERLLTQRRSLETNVEEAVRGTLARLQVPRREQVLELTARLDRLAERVDALARRRK